MDIYCDGYGNGHAVEAGVIDDAAIALFTRGQCHALALVLMQMLGWDGAVLTFYGSGGAYHPGAHLLAAAPDGSFVDIRGLQTLTDLEQMWCTEVGDRIEITVYDYYMMGGYIDSGPTQYAYPKLDLAHSMARVLIQQLGLDASASATVTA